MLKMMLSLLLLFFVLTACVAPQLSPTAEMPTQTAIIVRTTRVTTVASNVPVSPSVIQSATPTQPMATVLPTSTPSPMPTAIPTPAPTPTLLGDCAEIWQSGFYVMTNDFKTKQKRFNCMIVMAKDVVIDCDHHSIEGLDYQGYGFWIRRYNFPFLETPQNVEIRNCRVLKSRTGLFAEAGINLYIHDNDFSDNYDDTDARRYGIFLGMTEGGGIRLDHVQQARIENNTTNKGAIGIDIRDSQNIAIRNNTSSNNSAWGVSLLNTQDSEISGNTLRDNVRWCTWGDAKTVGPGCDAAAVILQDGASRNVVKNNTIAGQNANGVFIKAHGTRCGDDNTIQNNTISDAMYNAIEFSFCRGNRVLGNEISGSYDAVWFGFSANTEVRGNIIRNMTNHGIISYNSHDSNITENQISNAREGIYFYWDTWNPKQFYFLTPTADQFASRGNQIEGNTLRDNAVAGIHLSNSIQNRIQNNTFTNNGKTIWVEGKTDGNVITGR